MNQEWFLPREIAGIPGMPGTERAVQYIAKTKGWPFRPRQGRGGGREYHISSLPEATRLHLAAKSIKAGHGISEEIAARVARRHVEERERRLIAGEKRLAAYSALLPEQRRVADARADVVKALELYVKKAGFATVKAGAADFATRYNRREIEISSEVLGLIPTVSSSTLFRWRKLLAEAGPAALTNHYHNPKQGSTSLIPAQQDFCIAMLVDHPHCTFQTIFAGMQARFNGQTPNISAIRRFVSRWRDGHKSLLLFMRNPDEWRNKHLFAFGDADEQIERVNQRWEFDSTPADLLLTDGRHCVIGVVDVFSRRFRLLVAKSSKSTAVAGLLRIAILAWGVPEEAKTDNGSDYVSKHLVGAFEALGIEQILCPPFTPEAKPHIERAFRTFSHGIVELLPGYIGHSVADRKAIEARRSFADRLMKRGEPGGQAEPIQVSLTASEFQQLCDRWCEAIYHQNPHHGLDGKSPAEVARAWQGEARRIADVRALDILLAEAPRDTCTVTKKGIRIDHRHHIADALAGLEGEQVRVKLDPADLGTVYVFSLAGRFICTAVDPLRLGHDRAEIAARTKALQKRIVHEGSRELRKLAREQATRTIHTELLEYREAQIANIVELPKRSEEYTTEALEQAALAAAAKDADLRGQEEMEDIDQDWGTLGQKERLVSLARERPEEKVVLIFTDSQRYDQIKDTAKALGYIAPDNWHWLDEYYQSVTGRMYFKLEGDLRQRWPMQGGGQAEG